MDNIFYDSSFVYRVCLDEYTTDIFKGNVYSSLSEDVITFISFDDFIIKMDIYMDIHGPQSYQDKRTFRNQKIQHSSFDLPQVSIQNLERLNAMIGKQMTFTLALTSRRNTEWQGIFYQDNKTKQDFCNIIDLTKLIFNNMKK